MINICNVLKESKNICVIGISDNPERDSGRIAKFLAENGFNVIGVHPKLKEVFGIKVFNSLEQITQRIDIVDIFISGERITEMIDSIIKINPKYVWFQLGIFNDYAVKKFENHGIKVIQNHCIAVEYRNCQRFINP